MAFYTERSRQAFDAPSVENGLPRHGRRLRDADGNVLVIVDLTSYKGDAQA